MERFLHQLAEGIEQTDIGGAQGGKIVRYSCQATSVFQVVQNGFNILKAFNISVKEVCRKNVLKNFNDRGTGLVGYV